MSLPPHLVSSPSAPTHSSSHQPLHYQRGHLRATSDTASLSGRAALSPTTAAFPSSILRPFRPNPSSTSLVPSTAEGRPIPVDDSTVEHRTSALRELNHNYPSRYRYERSTGAQSSTYSEPVIVRSYYSPLPARPISTSRGGVIVHGGAGTVSQSGGSATAERRSLPFAATVTTARNGMMNRMARTRDRTGFGSRASEDTKLPPVEAFTFKSFMANMETAQDGENDINADLDRIAEICAKSRYSLSNQYEVHYAPHGSGSSFLNMSRAQDTQGPTLQIVSSDDERSLHRQRRRRNGARRNSRAMGTLETIMSSSRSSDEDRSKKRSAADLADEVRGRAVRKESGHTSPTTSSRSIADDQQSHDEQLALRTSPGRKAASLALIDSSKPGATAADQAAPRGSATTLVGEPAQPKASTSHLEIRTAPELSGKEVHEQTATHRVAKPGRSDVAATNPQQNNNSNSNGLFSTLTGWMSWRPPGTSATPPGRAEGSLRELLRTTDGKGKGVESHL